MRKNRSVGTAKILRTHENENARVTRVGIVCVEEVDLLTSVSVHITSGNSNSSPCPVPQGVVRRVTVIHSNVNQPVLSAIVLQHQVGPIEPERERQKAWFCSKNFCKDTINRNCLAITLALTLPQPPPGHHRHPRLSQPSHN